MGVSNFATDDGGVVEHRETAVECLEEGVDGGAIVDVALIGDVVKRMENRALQLLVGAVGGSACLLGTVVPSDITEEAEAEDAKDIDSSFHHALLLAVEVIIEVETKPELAVGHTPSRVARMACAATWPKPFWP